jgi:hypothetical protein
MDTSKFINIALKNNILRYEANVAGFPIINDAGEVITGEELEKFEEDLMKKSTERLYEDENVEERVEISKLLRKLNSL